MLPACLLVNRTGQSNGDYSPVADATPAAERLHCELAVRVSRQPLAPATHIAPRACSSSPSRLRPTPPSLSRTADPSRSVENTRRQVGVTTVLSEPARDSLRVAAHRFAPPMANLCPQSFEWLGYPARRPGSCRTGPTIIRVELSSTGPPRLSWRTHTSPTNRTERRRRVDGRWP